ncbi:flagellar motor switch phosphatase FliY [Carboxydothermus islandicus]|uniref:Flagellar motor switch phosphatase FliY n=1 Tax=Carboxydothermus islandicus TaxID=661089 RepID=A0A1L8D4Z0_9THEO|nr:flagellar motor switch phosphatase FliY [Carboxydothermus islandicus]GAV26184.1 flagellar motor switch phosphatase FliY [Carboxydothermus islandicus]
MDNQFLSQEEIDALLRGGPVPSEAERSNSEITNRESSNSEVILTEEEKDALGEAGNISMGSAATSLSQLVGRKVIITSPRVEVKNEKEFFSGFQEPYMVIEVEFTEGLSGKNVLIIKENEVGVIASLMMGGDGTHSGEITELEQSAAQEAMNQMIASSATSLSEIFKRKINISPPRSKMINSRVNETYEPFGGQEVVVIYFNMQIEDLVDTDIMQVMEPKTAKEVAQMLLAKIYGSPEPETVVTAEEVIGGEKKENIEKKFQKKETEEQLVLPADEKLELILDIPLKVEVVLGRTRRPIKEILSFGPGAIIDLDRLVDEDVEVLVNGTLVAKGEIVVVGENFGVKINQILSPKERLSKI